MRAQIIPKDSFKTLRAGIVLGLRKMMCEESCDRISNYLNMFEIFDHKTAAHGNRCRKEARRGVQGLKTKPSSVLVDTGMAKGYHKKTHTPEDISSKNSVLADQLIGGLDNKYDDSVQKLIDIGKEKGYLLYDEVSDLLPPEIGASAQDLNDLFSAFGTAGIEVIAAADQNFAALDKISGEKKFDNEATEEGIELDLTA